MGRAKKRKPHWALTLALAPMTVAALVGFLGTLLWTVAVSMTNSRMFPSSQFVGLLQYQRLFASEKWQVALQHLALYAVVAVSACMVIGFLLAVFIDQKIRAESLFRSIFLYPYAMSMVVTGLVWQWVLNPELGIQAAVRRWGFESFTLDWVVSEDMVMYCIILAAVWQASGLVMAILLAGLRGVDEEIWKAARLDGIPTWRVYVSVVVPMISGSIATAFVLQSVAAIKVFDLVNVMTQGGPGFASEVPAKFILDQLFLWSGVGQASAASVVLLLTVATLVVPYLYWRKRQAEQLSARGG